MRKRLHFILALFLLWSCSDQFAWLPEPPPSVHEVLPANGSAGTSVTISGNSFSLVPGENSVLFNDVPATVMRAGKTKLEVIVPSSTTGPVTVIIKGKTADYKPVFTYD